MEAAVQLTSRVVAKCTGAENQIDMALTTLASRKRNPKLSSKGSYNVD